MATRLFTLFIFTFITLASHAYNVTINGTAATYAGQEIAAFKYKNHFTLEFEVLQTAVISQSGTFELNLNTEQCEPIFLRIGYINATMYIQPDAIYEVDFPALPNGVARTINNTNEVDLLITKFPSKDINTLMEDYHARYVDFIDRNQHKINSKVFSGLVDTFQTELDSVYGHILFPYFKTHISYHLAALKFNSPSSKKKLYETYILNQPILYNHPAYVQFITLFYENYLYRFDVNRGKEEVLSAIEFQKSYNALLAAMLQDDFLKNVQLAELIIITGLRDLYNQQYASKTGIQNILKLAQDLCRFTENKELALSVYKLLTKFEKGFPAPTFALYDKKNNVVSLKDFKGKYVYINFWATWCSDCLRQMSVIKELNEMYHKDIAFVSISVDENKEDMLQFLEKNPEFEWSILYAGNDLFLKESYGLRTIPNYFLIDNEGNHFMPFTIGPSEGIDAYFAEIQRKLHPLMRFVPGSK